MQMLQFKDVLLVDDVCARCHAHLLQLVLDTSLGVDEVATSSQLHLL